MKIKLTQEILASLPKLYATEDVPLADKVAVCKFFDPCGSYTLYAVEYDGRDTFFGWVDGCPEPELGYFSLSEMESVRGPLGIGIERDLHFKPAKLAEVMK